MTYRAAFWTLALGAFLSAWWVTGCGEVTERPELQAEHDGGSDGVAETHTAGSPDSGPGRDAVDNDTVPTSPPPPCSAAAGCASCLQAGGTPGGFVSVAQCAAVISCVRAGGQGAYPWQDCANMHGASLLGGGLARAQGLVQACP